jgi:hypothetical protein
MSQLRLSPANFSPLGGPVDFTPSGDQFYDGPDDLFAATDSPEDAGSNLGFHLDNTDP